MKDLIPQIKERFDILEVAEKHLSLKKVGKEYFGLCPFHSEKTPSFSISQEKGVYYY